jgi:hypothetical protein
MTDTVRMLNSSISSDHALGSLPLTSPKSNSATKLKFDEAEDDDPNSADKNDSFLFTEREMDYSIVSSPRGAMLSNRKTPIRSRKMRHLEKSYRLQSEND